MNRRMEARSPGLKTGVGDPEKQAKQEFRESCDINNIVRRYGSRGQFDHIETRSPMYGDFTASVDLGDAYRTIESAEEEFYSLPASVRKAADNDPVKFLQMLHDEAKVQELVDAGLPVEGKKASPEAPPVPPPAVPASPGKGEPAGEEPAPK